VSDALSAARAAERAADRDSYLTLPTPTRAIEAAPAPLDETDPTVAAWLDRVAPAERAAQSLVLAQFCAWCQESPGELIERIFDREAYRYLRRDHYRQQILEFSIAGGGEWDDQLARGDVIRAFFKANGHTIARPRPPWQIWAQMP
jgi:hypothetical protein